MPEGKERGTDGYKAHRRGVREQWAMDNDSGGAVPQERSLRITSTGPISLSYTNSTSFLSFRFIDFPYLLLIHNFV